jgi:hypothetical protein
VVSGQGGQGQDGQDDFESVSFLHYNINIFIFIIIVGFLRPRKLF